MNFKMSEHSGKAELIEEKLKEIVSDLGDLSSHLNQAMEYSLMAGGKRFRPLLHLVTGEALGLDIEALLPTACGIELVHTYSLIHDDLPALDNDKFRRGKPTSHIVFGEDAAIMAGDALFSEAFYVILNNDLLSTKAAVGIASLLAEITGARGMVGGQMLDLRAVGTAIPDELMRINENKTAKLISFSVESAGLAAGLNTAGLDCLKKYGMGLGTAFQIIDDVLDITGDELKLGKDLGSDQRKNKVTLASLIGVDAARDRADKILTEAEETIGSLNYDLSELIKIGRSVADRDH